MTKIRFFFAPVLSFFDLKIYRAVCHLKTSVALLYLAYLSLIFTLVLVVFGYMQWPRMNEFLYWTKNNLPEMTFSQTGMKLDQPGHYELNHPRWGVLAIFDDARETVTPDEMGAALIYVASKTMYVRKNGEIQARPIHNSTAKAFSLHVDSAFVQKIYDQVKAPLIGLILFLIFVLGWVSRLVGALFFAMIGYLLQALLRKQLTFQNLFNLSAFVLSINFPFSILQYVPNLARFFPGYLGVVLALVYLGLAIVTQPKTERA